MGMSSLNGYRGIRKAPAAFSFIISEFQPIQPACHTRTLIKDRKATRAIQRAIVLILGWKMVVKDFDADVFALIQCIDTGKEDENTEQQPVREPTPDKRMVKDIPGGYVNSGDDHDHKTR